MLKEIAKSLASGESADALTTLSAAAAAGGPEVTAALGKLLAEAIPKPWRFGPDVGSLDDGFEAACAAGMSVELALATAQALEAAGNPRAAELVEAAAMKPIEAAVDDWNEAQANFAQAEIELGQLLAEDGGGMTSAQREEYVEAFWANPKNAAVKEALADAEETLASVAQTNGPALEAAGSERAGEMLLSVYETLATTPHHAGEALDFVDRLGRSENKALFDALNADGSLEERLADEVLAPAIGSAQAQAMANGSMSELTEQLKSIYELGKNFAELPGQLKDAVELTETVSEMLAKGMTGREVMTALRAAGLTEGWEDKSKLGKALAVFGFMSSVAGVIEAGEDGLSLELLEESLGTLEGGMELGAALLGSLGKAGRIAGGEAAAEVLSKYLPFVSIAVDGVQLGKDIKELVDDGTVGDWVSVFGSGINVIGDVAGLVPIFGTAVDGVLTTVGTILQGVGGFLDAISHGGEAGAERAKDRRTYLEAAGLSEAVIDLLMTDSFVEHSALATMGLTPDQYLGVLADIAEMNGDDLERTANVLRVSWGMAAAHGLTGQDALDFVKETAAALQKVDAPALAQMQYQLVELQGQVLSLQLQGATPEQIRAEIGEQLDTLRFAFNDNEALTNIILEWDLDLKPVSDFNVDYFTSMDEHG